MLRFLCLLLLVTRLVGTTLAQQKPWQPFPFGQVGYYQNAGDTLMNGDIRKDFYTVSVDSAELSGSDTLLYLNRKLFSNEPLCHQPGATHWSAVPPAYFTKNPYDRAHLKISGDTVGFYNDSVLHSRWIFDKAFYTTLDVYQTIGFGIYAYDSSWYDNDIQDSVRRVSLFASLNPLSYIEEDAMHISKFHGLTQFKISKGSFNITAADDSAFHFRLCGFKNNGTEWGYEPLEIERYFAFHPGDIIKWREINTGVGQPIFIHRDSVLSTINTEDSVTVFYHRHTFVESFDTLLPYAELDDSVVYDLQRFRKAVKRTSYQPVLDSTNWTNPFNGYSLWREYYTYASTGCCNDTVTILVNNDVFSNYYHLSGDSLCTDSITMNSPVAYITSLSTQRGYLGDLTGWIGGQSTISQLGYHSPLKGISCGDYCSAGIYNPSLSTNLSLYPNPANEELTVHFYQPVSGTLQIIDATGKTLKLQQLNTNALVELNVSNLLPAVYFIRVFSNNSVYTSKFIKQ